jgi:hypothetical protein
VCVARLWGGRATVGAGDKGEPAAWGCRCLGVCCALAGRAGVCSNCVCLCWLLAAAESVASAPAGKGRRGGRRHSERTCDQPATGRWDGVSHTANGNRNGQRERERGTATMSSHVVAGWCYGCRDSAAGAGVGDCARYQRRARCRDCRCSSAALRERQSRLAASACFQGVCHGN